MRIDLQLGNIFGLDRSDGTKTTPRSDSSAVRTEPDAHEPEPGSSLRSATMRAMAEPEVRSERIQQLRDQIQSGCYKPDPGAIAGAMIEELLPGSYGPAI